MPVSSANIIYHPSSRFYNECQAVFTSERNKCDMDPLLYYFGKYDNVGNKNTRTTQVHSYENVTPLTYSEFNFRSASYPILWLDSFGDVRWNEVAESEMYQLLLDKQFPKRSNTHSYEYKPEDYVKDCESRPMILLEQWAHGGFFSRVNCFIEIFGQSLYSPLMAVLLPKLFSMSSAGAEDFMHEGILRYYAPMSQCSAYMPQDRLKNISDNVLRIRDKSEKVSDYAKIYTFDELRETRPDKKYLWLEEQSLLGYEHVPHRRWLFDRNRYKSKTSVYYNSSVDVLTDHTLEHIYHAPNLTFNLQIWHPRNTPHFKPSIYLNSSYGVTWKDKVFCGFLRYIFILFFHQFAPRIVSSQNFLGHYWSTYLRDNKHQPYYEPLSSMATVYVRRGDHTREDLFYARHGHWRNISLFLRTLDGEEKRANKTFSSIFFLSDDSAIVNSALEFASKQSLGPDEPFARQYLFGRSVIHNLQAPESCRQPFSRFDFDQYLVSVLLIIRHSAVIVTQPPSNLATYLEAVVYALNQLLPYQQTNTRIKYVVD